MPTFDAASVGSGGGAGPITFNHTCSGSDRLLLVACHAADENFSVTYNGVSMTELYDGTPGSPFKHIAVYALVAPATGANTVSITKSSTSFLIGCAVSYTDVDQADPYDAIDVVTGSGVTPSNTVASASGALVVDFLAANTDATLTVGASQTARVNSGNGDEFVYIGSSEEAGAASVDMTWTGYTGAWTQAGLSLNPASGGGAAGHPTIRRFGGVPHMSNIRRGGPRGARGTWGRTKSGIIVPERFAA